MRKVLSVDFTAAHMLAQIHSRIEANGGSLLLSSIPLDLPSGQNVREYLLNLGFSESKTLHFFNDLETALEFVEDEILTEEFQEALVSPIEMNLKSLNFLMALALSL
jgi:SulP family sulfate permease